MATVTLAQKICALMNVSKDDKVLIWVLERTLAEVCIECHINYEFNKYLGDNGEYRLTTGILNKMPRRLQAA